MYNVIPSMVSCTCFDTVGVISINECGVASSTFTEQVMLSSLALSGDRVSWLIDVDESLVFKMTTLSLSLDRTIPDLDQVKLIKMSMSALP